MGTLFDRAEEAIQANQASAPEGDLSNIRVAY